MATLKPCWTERSVRTVKYNNPNATRVAVRFFQVRKSDGVATSAGPVEVIEANSQKEIKAPLCDRDTNRELVVVRSDLASKLSPPMIQVGPGKTLRQWLRETFPANTAAVATLWHWQKLPELQPRRFGGSYLNPLPLSPFLFP